MVPIDTASLKYCVDNRKKWKPNVTVTMKEGVVIVEYKSWNGHVSLSKCSLCFIEVIVLYYDRVTILSP